MVPGPPPVITAIPASPSALPTSRACSYSSSPGDGPRRSEHADRGPTSFSFWNPSVNSASIRARRSASERSEMTAGHSALMISSSEVLGACASGRSMRPG